MRKYYISSVVLLYLGLGFLVGWFGDFVCFVVDIVVIFIFIFIFIYLSVMPYRTRIAN